MIDNSPTQTPTCPALQEHDERFMRRCLQLATNGLGRTRPNPMVGCVIVKDGRIVSEGFHQRHGENHAERNALLHCKEDCTDATLYVNLEPCSHQGLTPPCADLIVERRIGRVVCCNDDPNPLVSGNGFRKLEAAGISISRHILEEEGRYLNRRFFTFMEKRRPYVILKWAQSADGLMAPEQGDQSSTYWLSTPLQNRLNHRWRTEEAAILVGSNTFLADSPSLTARHYLGPQPLPIVLDRRSRLLPNELFLPTGRWLHLDSPTIEDALTELYHHKVQSVIVEGGRRILDAFLQSGLFDEIRILRSPTILGKGLSAPPLSELPQEKTIIID